MDNFPGTDFLSGHLAMLFSTCPGLALLASNCLNALPHGKASIFYWWSTLLYMGFFGSCRIKRYSQTFSYWHCCNSSGLVFSTRPNKFRIWLLIKVIGPDHLIFNPSFAETLPLHCKIFHQTLAVHRRALKGHLECLCASIILFLSCKGNKCPTCSLF